MLISLHISKTAGTAFRIFLESNLGRAAAFAYAGERGARPEIRQAMELLKRGEAGQAKEMIQQGGVEAIHGHVAYEFLQAFPDAATMTWLRDPVQRAVSEWLTMKRSPDPENPESVAVANGEANFEAFLEKRRDFLSHCVGLLQDNDRPLALFAAERAGEAAEVMRRELGWRGAAPSRNRTPASAQEEAAALTNTHADSARDILGADIALHRQLLAEWDSGAAAERAALALRDAPHRRAASPLRRARRAAGVARERAGRFLRRDWA